MYVKVSGELIIVTQVELKYVRPWESRIEFRTI